MANKAILAVAMMLCASAAVAAGYQCQADGDCKANSPCQYGVCSYGKCVYKQRPEGYGCNPGKLGQCQYGACSYGKCVTKQRPDGYACSDGNACTVGDKCSYGACRPGQTKSCYTKDTCKTSSCNKATGKCEEKPKAEGSPCNDGNKCTVNDKCSYGVCKGSPKSCPAAKQCYKSYCYAATGDCKTDTLPDGTACNDGDYNTSNDKCSYGVCKGTRIYG